MDSATAESIGANVAECFRRTPAESGPYRHCLPPVVFPTGVCEAIASLPVPPTGRGDTGGPRRAVQMNWVRNAFYVWHEQWRHRAVAWCKRWFSP